MYFGHVFNIAIDRSGTYIQWYNDIFNIAIDRSGTYIQWYNDIFNIAIDRSGTYIPYNGFNHNMSYYNSDSLRSGASLRRRYSQQ